MLDAVRFVAVALARVVWVWQHGSLRRAAGPLHGDTLPIVEGFAPDGRVRRASGKSIVYDAVRIRRPRDRVRVAFAA